MISKTAIILKEVKLGKNPKIGDFCIIGEKQREDKGLKTLIGDNANIRSHSVLYSGNKIGDNFCTGHGVLIREENKIGDNVSIGSHTVIEHHVIIGNNVRIHSNSFIPEFSILEDNCWIGPNVTFTNVLHPLCPKAKKCIKGPLIKKGVKIGAGCIILPGITIGKNSLVGAGSIVVRDVLNDVVVSGNPAKIIKKISDLKCPYKLINNPYV